MDTHGSGFRPTDGQLRNARILAHLPNFVRLYWRLFKDPRTGWIPRIVLLAGLAYLLIPIDFLPDFLAPLAGLGLVDDAIILILAAKAFIHLSPRPVVEEHVHLIDNDG